MNEWLWECKEHKEQAERKRSERWDKDFFYSREEQQRRLDLKNKVVCISLMFNNRYFIR